MISFLLEKISKMHGEPKVLVANAYKNALLKTQAKPNGREIGEKYTDFIKSRSCYKQYIRLLHSKEPKKISKEAFYLAKKFKEAGFDITLVKDDIGKSVTETYRQLQRLIAVSPIDAEKSILSIYMDAVKILNNSSIRRKIVQWDKEIETIIKNGVIINNKSPLNDQKKIYQYSYMIMSYVNLMYLVTHLTATFATIAAEVYEYPNGMTPAIFNDIFYKRYYHLFYKSVLNHVVLIVYFQNTDLNKIEKFMNQPIDEDKAQEDWQAHRYDEYYGLEAIFTTVVVALGVALGLSLILPIIRGLIYYWGSLKIDLSNFFKNEAIFFAYNVERLREQLETTQDEKTRARLEKAIEKQEALIEKLKAKGMKWSIEYETCIKEATIVADEDEAIEEQDTYDYYNPDVVF